MIKAVILDWAGTTVDYGSLAPVAAFQAVFGNRGIAVSAEEVQSHMGLLKRQHLQRILEDEGVARRWRDAYGALPGPAEIDALYREFEPVLAEVLPRHSEPTPGTLAVVDRLRRRVVRIGATTGYTRATMRIVMPQARLHGYVPDFSVAADEVPEGRPAEPKAEHG